MVFLICPGSNASASRLKKPNRGREANRANAPARALRAGLYHDVRSGAMTAQGLRAARAEDTATALSKRSDDVFVEQLALKRVADGASKNVYAARVDVRRQVPRLRTA